MKGRLDRKGDHQSWLQHRCKQGGPGALPGLGGALFIGKFSPPWFLVSCSSCTRQHVQSVLMDLSGNGSRSFGGLFVVLVPLYWLAPQSAVRARSLTPLLHWSCLCVARSPRTRTGKLAPERCCPRKALPHLHTAPSRSHPGLILV